MRDESMWSLVPGLLLVPLIAAMIVAALGQRRREAIRWISLAAVGLDLILALTIAVHFVGQPERITAKARVPTFNPVLVTRFDLLRLPGLQEDDTTHEHTAIRFYVGIDGLNIWLVVLTAVLMVSSVLISWTAIHHRVHEYYAWLL